MTTLEAVYIPAPSSATKPMASAGYSWVGWGSGAERARPGLHAADLRTGGL